MNYIELINWFWELDETWQFTCCETRLYFYIVKTANRLGWVDSWTHSDAKTAANVGVSINSFKTARNRLVQAGLLKVINGGKFHGDKTRYQILTPKPQPNLIPKPQPKHEPNLEPLNKPNKTKLEYNPPLSPKGEKGAIKNDFIDDLVKCFAEKYSKLRDLDYTITNKGKERAAAAKILKIYKGKYPESDTESTLDGLGNYFEDCLNIPDKWLNQNMSLSMIVNKFNDINYILKNGNKPTKGQPATTDAELAGVFAKHFATDYCE